MASVLIAAPDIEEAQPLVDGLVKQGFPCDPIELGALRCWQAAGLDALVAVGGNSKAQFALQTQFVIDHHPGIEALLCVGAAGRLDHALQLGDIVIGTASVEHDYKERFNPAPLPTYEPDPRLLQELQRAAGTRRCPFRVCSGPIASGDEDIVEPRRAEEIRAATQAFCVAWEGSGAARVGQFNDLAFLEIRGITDAADAEAAASFYKNVARVMSNIAELLAAWRSLYL